MAAVLLFLDIVALLVLGRCDERASDALDGDAL
jgi:hypothetical protein